MKKSVVLVYFPQRNMKLSYYNDQFDLEKGDIVFVEGKLEGLRGRVLEVNYNFKIKLSDYKKVIAVADNNIKGRFYNGESHFVTFDNKALPVSKVLTWFKAPDKEDDEYVSGTDDFSFELENFKGLEATKKVCEDGNDYYINDRVKYLCIDNGRGFAVVSGREHYRVEFVLEDGKISELMCSCYCSGTCKHEIAAFLQLKETLKKIKKSYEDLYTESRYFVAVEKDLFISLVIDSKENGYIEV